jgi:tetratricopeptide (TPR) repeat protein
VAGAGIVHAQTGAENLARYERTQVQWGATTLTLPAQIHYQFALAEAEKGNIEAARANLEQSIALDPQFPDAYFTMSWLQFRSFDPDALFNLVAGIKTVWKSFHAQSLLVVNVLLIAVLLLVMVASIVCIAFAIRYLPFAAYRLAEAVDTRFNAALPRAAALFVVLIPFALFPGFVTGFCLLLVMAWHFMHRRERVTMVLLIVPFVGLALLAPRIDRYATAANPASFVSLATASMTSAANGRMIAIISETQAPGLESEKHNVLGILQLRQENFDVAADHFLKAIAIAPEDPVAYINLGNVYYIQGVYEKALEGYRKADRLAPNDPVGQYNLAQAYIKTLLLAESSKALKNAAARGIDGVKQSYAELALPHAMVYPRAYSNGALWRIAAVEGSHTASAVIDDGLRPITRFGVRSTAMLMVLALIVALILGRAIRPWHLAFQCSNCGELTSESSCNSERGTFICAPCYATIASVSSDKVIEALLRQRRQKVLVRRRRAIRFVTTWLPGIRDIFYGRLTRGILLAAVFSFSLIQLWAKGYVIDDWNTLVNSTPLWKWILPALGITMTYLMSVFSRQYKEVRNYRSSAFRPRMREDELAAKKVTA